MLTKHAIVKSKHLREEWTLCALHPVTLWQCPSHTKLECNFDGTRLVDFLEIMCAQKWILYPYSSCYGYSIDTKHDYFISTIKKVIKKATSNALLTRLAAPRARVSRHSVLSVGCSAQKTNLYRQPCARTSDTREAVSGDTRVECSN